MQSTDSVPFDFNRKAFLTYLSLHSSADQEAFIFQPWKLTSNSLCISKTIFYLRSCKWSQTKPISSSRSPVANAQRWINCPELGFDKQIPLRSTKTESGQKTGLTGAKSTCSHQFMMHKWVNRSRVRSSIVSCYTSACWWPRTRQLKCSILQNYHSLPCMLFTNKQNLANLFISEHLCVLSYMRTKQETQKPQVLPDLHFECLSQRAEERMSQRRIVPLLLL